MQFTQAPTTPPRTTKEYIAAMSSNPDDRNGEQQLIDDAQEIEQLLSNLRYNPDDRNGEQQLIDDAQEIEQLLSDILDGEDDLLEPFARVLLAPYGIDADAFSPASHHLQVNIWRFSPDERSTIIAVLRMVLLAQESEVWAIKREAKVAEFKRRAQTRHTTDGEDHGEEGTPESTESATTACTPTPEPA